MPRDTGLYLEDMLEAARRLADYVEGLDHGAFAVDARTIDAANDPVPLADIRTR